VWGLWVGGTGGWKLVVDCVLELWGEYCVGVCVWAWVTVRMVR
jgi:hypothetical protein